MDDAPGVYEMAELQLRTDLALNATHKQMIAEAVAEATARERQRIREALFALHNSTLKDGRMPGWHRFADLLDGDGDA